MSLAVALLLEVNNHPEDTTALHAGFFLL